MNYKLLSLLIIVSITLMLFGNAVGDDLDHSLPNIKVDIKTIHNCSELFTVLCVDGRLFIVVDNTQSIRIIQVQSGNGLYATCVNSKKNK
jgi:hypothetical protein